MLICIDYDGVIVDSIEQQLDVARTSQRLVGAGRVPELNDFKIIKDLSPLGFAEQIEVPLSHREIWNRCVHEQMIRTQVPAPAFPFATEFLLNISAFSTVAIITSNAREVVERFLIQSSLLDRISEIYDSSMPGTKDMKIKQAMAKFQSNTHGTCMIGDTMSDIRAGKKAGVRTIGVAWGYQAEELLKQENPDFIADNFSELQAFLFTIEKEASSF